MSSLSHRATARSRVIKNSAAPAVASAYDGVGEAYLRYADMPAGPPAATNFSFAHADRVVWFAIRDAIEARIAAGASSIRVLDVGCGPGTWIMRARDHAKSLGLGFEGVGTDIARVQLEIARQRNAGASSLTFVEHDAARVLPWPNGAFDIVLCNYIVLNHLERDGFRRAAAELCRVARHTVVASLRAIGGPPTACIASLDDARQCDLSPADGKLTVTLKSGISHCFTLNLYSASEIRKVFTPYAHSLDLRAVDIFANRFAPHAHWNASRISHLRGRSRVVEELYRLEEQFCRQEGWVDHGTHVLLVAQVGHHLRNARSGT